VLAEREGGGRFRRNLEEYELDLRTLVWRRTTDRNWPQFTIHAADRRWFDLDHRPDFEAFRPTGIPHEVLPPADWNSYQLLIRGITVRFIVGVREVEVLIEGALPADTVGELVHVTRRYVEAAIGRECVVDES
jgi:hypothetical protein